MTEAEVCSTNLQDDDNNVTQVIVQTAESRLAAVVAKLKSVPKKRIPKTGASATATNDANDETTKKSVKRKRPVVKTKAKPKATPKPKPKPNRFSADVSASKRKVRKISVEATARRAKSKSTPLEDEIKSILKTSEEKVSEQSTNNLPDHATESKQPSHYDISFEELGPDLHVKFAHFLSPILRCTLRKSCPTVNVHLQKPVSQPLWIETIKSLKKRTAASTNVGFPKTAITNGRFTDDAIQLLTEHQCSNCTQPADRIYWNFGRRICSACRDKVLISYIDLKTDCGIETSILNGLKTAYIESTGIKEGVIKEMMFLRSDVDAKLLEYKLPNLKTSFDNKVPRAAEKEARRKVRSAALQEAARIRVKKLDALRAVITTHVTGLLIDAEPLFASAMDTRRQLEDHVRRRVNNMALRRIPNQERFMEIYDALKQLLIDAPRRRAEEEVAYQLRLQADAIERSNRQDRVAAATHLLTPAIRRVYHGGNRLPQYTDFNWM